MEEVIVVTMTEEWSSLMCLDASNKWVISVTSTAGVKVVPCLESTEYALMLPHINV